MSRNICVVTGTRAEYGLLHPLLAVLASDADICLQLVVTGTHLSPEFGRTEETIRADGFTNVERLEMLLSSDTPVGMAKSTGLAVIGFADLFSRLAPDIVVVLGDRYEILAAAQTAMLLQIPIAHIHGGEITEGAVDDSIRHAVTKMASLHFVSEEEHRQRVLQMGEAPEHVYLVGALGWDAILGMEFLSLPALGRALDFPLNEAFFLFTYHPETRGEEGGASSLEDILAALDAFPAHQVLMTKANSDAGGRAINRRLEQYAEEHPERCVLCASLGTLRYLSAMRACALMIGNSSSALLEAPLFGVPAVNIGSRQKGRYRYGNVIDVRTARTDIERGIREALSPHFQEMCRDAVIPLADGNVAKRIAHVLKNVPLEDLCRKRFHDLQGLGLLPS